MMIRMIEDNEEPNQTSSVMAVGEHGGAGTDRPASNCLTLSQSLNLQLRVLARSFRRGPGGIILAEK